MKPALDAVRRIGAGAARRVCAVRWLSWLLATGLYLAVVAPSVVPQLRKPARHWLIDLTVYRQAGRMVIDDSGDLYKFHTVYQSLPFTYPPFPAVLATGLAVLPLLVVGLLWTAACLVTVVALTRVLFRRVVARSGAAGPFVLAGLSAWMFWLMPVRDVLKFGQVGLFIVAMVLADCLARCPRWPAGVLVGLAAAVKLTPALFIPYLWLTGRRRAAYTAVGAFVAAQALCFAVIPAAASDYWTRALFASNRLGSNAGTSNQSIRGMLLRTHVNPHVQSAVWLALVVPVLIVGMRRAVAAHRAGDEVCAVGVVGLLTVALSPVSWIHHMCWMPLLVAVLADDLRDRRRLAAALALSAFFLFRLPWWGHSLSLGHGGFYPARILQDCFGLAALALIAGIPWRTRRTAAGSARHATDVAAPARKRTAVVAET